MTPLKAQLTEVPWLDIEMPTYIPEIEKEEYEQRIQHVRDWMKDQQVSHTIVYADREHAANMAFLCKYEPRFEEALLIIPLDSTPTLLVGNEGLGYTGISPLDLEIQLYQSFSLLGQDRSQSPALMDILDKAGINTKSKVAVAGWKYFSAQESRTPQTWLEIPSYIADTLRTLVGKHEQVFNANEVFMNPKNGLRCVNSVDQLAFFEFAACHTSQGLKQVLQGMKPGMTEMELASLYKINGLPLSCHLMVSAGKKANMGLSSPSMNRLEVGQPFTSAYGVWGALNCRAGWLVSDESELPEQAKGYADQFAGKYFAAIAEWYETIGLDIPGGALYSLIHERLPQETFHIGLNPGHLIHLDEWVHSPVEKNSTIPFVSGMAVQVDVIPSHPNWGPSNIEDGIALADEKLRGLFNEKHPEAWTRMEKRRAHVEEYLHIRPKPEVLLFSNIQAMLPPYLLNPSKVFQIVR